MFSFQKIVLITCMVLLLIRPSAATAEQTLRTFTSDDVHLQHSAGGGFGGVQAFPLYGGSDKTGFLLTVAQSNELVPVLQFDLTHSVDGQDAIVGFADCRLPATCGLYLSGGDKLKSECALSPSAGFVPFRIPVPSGFVSGQLTLSFQPPGIYGSNEDRVAFANVRLVRGAMAASAALTPPPAAAAVALPPDDLVMENVRDFSGNDFDPHIDTSQSGPAPLLISNGSGQLVAQVYVPPVDPPRVIPVLALDDPPITQPDFAIHGQISYGGVDQDSDIDGYAYLEMLCDFADGSSSVTRTLADSGPLHLIHGRSGPRPFLLPVHMPGKHASRIRMNLVMAGRGTVTITDLQLAQYEKPAAIAAVPTAMRAESSPWFNTRLLWIPVAILPFFSLIALLEPLVLRGKGRTFVLTWIWVFFLLAQISLAWGMAALGHGVSIREAGPMLFTSMLILGATLFAVPRMSRRYRDAELRRMQLMDVV